MEQTYADVLRDHVRHQLDVALELSNQLQQRSQNIAASTTLLLTVIGLAATTNSHIVDRIVEAKLTDLALGSVFSAALAVLLGLVASFPGRVPFGDLSLVTTALESGDAAEPLSLLSVSERSVIDRRCGDIEVGLLKAVIDRNRWRGRFVTAALMLSAASILFAAQVLADLAS